LQTARRHLKIAHGKVAGMYKKRRAFLFSRSVTAWQGAFCLAEESDHCLWGCKISASLDLEPAACALYFMCVAETIMLPDVCLKLSSLSQSRRHTPEGNDEKMNEILIHLHNFSM